MNLLLYMAPIATLALIPATLILEPDAISTARQLAQEHPCESLNLPLTQQRAPHLPNSDQTPEFDRTRFN